MGNSAQSENCQAAQAVNFSVHFVFDFMMLTVLMSFSRKSQFLGRKIAAMNYGCHDKTLLTKTNENHAYLVGESNRHNIWDYKCDFLSSNSSYHYRAS